jgi:hypothetical protein
VQREKKKQGGARKTAEHAPSSAKRKEKAGRGSKDVPKGMQSTMKLQKAVPKGAQCKFSA